VYSPLKNKNSIWIDKALTRRIFHAIIHNKGNQVSLMNDVTFLKDTFMTRAETTAYIRSKGHHISSFSLSYLATQKLGPPYKIFGVSAIYSVTDVDAWILSYFRKSEKISASA
jgi:hypothetical protein